ncbi:MAG: tetratricopeptide repeat protein [Ignavibacteria bacterium]|nr:tetratricopeptide repeat protein [Ignavibacteria bacterium]
MKKTNILLVIVLLTGLVFSGFQCSSSELTSARLYIQQKNYIKAIDVLHKDVQKNPKSDEGWYLMGYTYGEMGNMDSLLVGYDNSLAVSNKFEKEINDSKIFYWVNKFNLGVNLFQRGNKTSDDDSAKIFYDKSIDAFNSAAMLEPDSADTYKNMAFVYMRSGRNKEAIKPFKQLVQLKQELDGYRYLGEIYYSLGNQKSSDYTSSGDVEDSLKAEEYYTDAINVLEEGVKNYPDDGDILKTLSASYIQVGKQDVALSSFKSLVDREPDNKIFRYNYGVLLLESNDYTGAEKQFLNALEIDSEYESATYNLGITYVRWGTALKNIEEETEQYTDEDIKKYELAVPYLEKVIESDPENGEIWEMLGKVYSLLNLQDKAMDAFNKSDQLR